jgi:hypothetical protein
MKNPSYRLKSYFSGQNFAQKKEKTPYEKEKVSLKHPWPYDPKHTL